MESISEAFTADYHGCDLVYGSGCIERLGAYLERNGLERALVICGSNVGANEAVIGPLRRGLGERLVGIFDETTPAKVAQTVYDGVAAVEEFEPDVLIGVGGGSSLDVARQVSVFAVDGRARATFDDALLAGEEVSPDPDETQRPVIVVPTTFAGADISAGGSIEFVDAADSPSGQPLFLSGEAMPIAAVYDPVLFEATPSGAIAGSVMNGFNKGIETIYGRDANPLADANAIHSLRILREALPKVADGDRAGMERAVVGLLLAQLERQTSVIHAFAHGLSRNYPVQQGTIHAVLAPHVLRYVFERVDARRDVLAQGFGLDPDTPADELADCIVAEVVAVRDAFDLPTRLREIGAVDRGDVPEIAAFIRDDPPMARGPTELEVSADEIEAVLREAW
ncbi:iron-containing alcohol dehydrogenase family protein [Natronobiforma cellulositropha]|uniref:iron-containing alcohol dehydrogenase family protein n=1 Tax=Natronobiforma cellulositropha TaxID=1679076 RepID=UPI0021D5A2B6|nr:iron-containing alcohol dehydrogenase family protein [Natronobiforma cellulositropha]